MCIAWEVVISTCKYSSTKITWHGGKLSLKEITGGKSGSSCLVLGKERIYLRHWVVFTSGLSPGIFFPPEFHFAASLCKHRNGMNGNLSKEGGRM